MLDIQTLLMATVTGALVCSVIFIARWQQHPGERETLYWGISYGAFALGAALLGARGTIADVWSIWFANAAVLSGHMLRVTAVRRFNGRRTAEVLIVAPAAIWTALCLVPAFYESFMARSVFNVGFAIATAIYMSWEFWRDRRDGLKTRYTIAALYLVAGVGGALLMFAHLHSSRAATNAVASSSVAGIFLLGTLAAMVGAAVLVFSLTLEREEKRQRDLAERDPLTSVCNRRALDRRGQEAVERCRRLGRPASVILFDLDHFKTINDRFGHTAGDEMLQRFAAICAGASRETDIVARVGGEEFALLLPEADSAVAAQVAERIRSRFAELVHGASRELSATASAGVCTMQGPALDLAALLDGADALLYQAKRDGRNRVISKRAAA